MTTLNLNRFRIQSRMALGSGIAHGALSWNCAPHGMEGMKMRNEMKEKMERTEEILNRDMKNLDMDVMWSTLPRGTSYTMKVSRQMTLDGYTDDEKKGRYFPVLNLTIDPRLLLKNYPNEVARLIRQNFHRRYQTEEWYTK